MSDFDEVLERLLTDPSFQAQLANDAVDALAGYQLEASEVELLRQQVSPDSGASAALVEDRVSKSSTFGLFSSFEGLGGVTDAVGSGVAGQGPAPTGSGLGPAPVGGGLGEWAEFGSAAGHVAQTASGQPATEGFGSAPDGWGAGGGEMAARTGFGSAPGVDDAPDLDGLPPVARLGDAPRTGLGDAAQEVGEALGGPGRDDHLAPPKGYDNQVDADGDGTFDKATYRGREDGGAEIRVDLNRDGEADFVGVDKDLDNRVDFADYDKDHDGVFEKRMFDDDGDGWLDRTVLQ
ncbi:hypothetical protein [Actinoplanes friuliensis]|uniref:Uncharacterized protein n=1 Tax=Actinoplanes friuliensis DSM 7358 TaxID=1246995 RepID=U5W9E9_9ACTN|nr:hypothetical protein [Actinoplanes friuliensis]AGZ45838.1 hypothetical protein AFR_37920 [Actinoplanes friuliensis DSM 7358]